MPIRKGEIRLHYPCSRCKIMFERQGGEKLCPECYYEVRRNLGKYGRKHGKNRIRIIKGKD